MFINYEGEEVNIKIFLKRKLASIVNHYWEKRNT